MSTWRHTFASSVPAFFTWPSFIGKFVSWKNRKRDSDSSTPHWRWQLRLRCGSKQTLLLFSACLSMFTIHSRTTKTLATPCTKGSALHFDHGLCKQRKEKTNRNYMCTSPWHRLFQRFWIDERFVFCSTHFMPWRMYCFSVHFLSFSHLCAPRSSQECQLYTPPEMDWIQLCLQTIHETQRIVKQTNHSQ